MPETGWKKDEPKIDGVYWWRSDDRDRNPDIHYVVAGRFYEVADAEARIVKNFGGEWLGPISHSDSEQLVRLREVAGKALGVLQFC